MWYFETRQTPDGQYILLLCMNLVPPGISKPFQHLCNAIKVGRAWVNSLDEAPAPDVIALAARHGIILE